MNDELDPERESRAGSWRRTHASVRCSPTSAQRPRRRRCLPRWPPGSTRRSPGWSPSARRRSSSSRRRADPLQRRTPAPPVGLPGHGRRGRRHRRSASAASPWPTWAGSRAAPTDSSTQRRGRERRSGGAESLRRALEPAPPHQCTRGRPARGRCARASRCSQPPRSTPTSRAWCRADQNLSSPDGSVTSERKSLDQADRRALANAAKSGLSRAEVERRRHRDPGAVRRRPGRPRHPPRAAGERLVEAFACGGARVLDSTRVPATDDTSGQSSPGDPGLGSPSPTP